MLYITSGDGSRQIKVVIEDNSGVLRDLTNFNVFLKLRDYITKELVTTTITKDTALEKDGIIVFDLAGALSAMPPGRYEGEVSLEEKTNSTYAETIAERIHITVRGDFT